MKSNIKISVFNSIEISIDKKRAEQRPCVSDYHHIKSIRNFDCISFHRLGWKLQNVGKNYVREMKEIHRRVQCYAAAACADIYVHLIFRCANANNRYVIIQNSHSLLLLSKHSSIIQLFKGSVTSHSGHNKWHTYACYYAYTNNSMLKIFGKK